MSRPSAHWRNSREEGNRGPMIAVAFVLRASPLLLALIFGCAKTEEASIRLTLISPHRDEIREEVAVAFKEWFQARTQERIDSLRRQLRVLLEKGGGDRVDGVEQAFAGLAADWRPDELDELRRAHLAWRQAPKPALPQNYLEALARIESEIPSVELVWQDIGGGTSQIARYVGARFESNPSGIGIDLLFGGGTEIFLRFAGQGLLERIDLPQAIFRDRIRTELHGIPLYDSEGRWYGPILSSFGILYNREILRRIGEPEPGRWSDLGEPGFFSWVSSGDPRLTGSVHMVNEIILQSQGWEQGFAQLLRMGANTHSFIRDSGTLTRTVTIGEVAVAGNLDANALSAVGRDPQRMGYNLPVGGTIVNPDAVAVLRGAPRKELARAFIEFTLSDAGQFLFLLSPGQPGGPRRYPLCRLSVVESLYARYPPEVRSVGAVNPFEIGGTISYDSNRGNNRWDALNDLIGSTIVDAHQDLVAARNTVLRLQSKEERARLEEELFSPPCSEKELMDHARNIVESSPRVRTLTVNRWGEEARQRYRRVRRSAEVALTR
jgi:ABC-type Fe3+ transport system substrate-binding protein